MTLARKETSTNYLNQQALVQTCVLNDVLHGISGRWKMQVLYAISQGQNRFSLLKPALPALSDQILGKRLRELESKQLIKRHSHAECVPVQISYTVTAKGESLLQLLGAMCEWAAEGW